MLSKSSLSLVAVAAGLGAMLTAAPAGAYCRTSTTSTALVDGHVCTPAADDDSGLPLYWGMPRITYSLQVDASQDVPFETARTAIRTAFDTWMAADCDGEPPRIEVIEADPATCARHEYNQERGNANILFFQDQDWDADPSKLAITTVTYSTSDGEIYDADMVMNSAVWHFITSGTGSAMADDIDLVSVFTHETGHFLGLAHSPAEDATMAAFYSPPEIRDLRSLAEDDRAGICAIYPPSPIAEDCDATPRHGFSVLCEDDQPFPVPAAALSIPDRCCCLDGDECVDGACIEGPGGCSCTTLPRPESPPWPAALSFTVVATALLRRRSRGC